MMRQPQNTAKLPRKLLTELGIDGTISRHLSNKTAVGDRKGRRRATRVQKKTRSVQSTHRPSVVGQSRLALRDNGSSDGSSDGSRDEEDEKDGATALPPSKATKPTVKKGPTIHKTSIRKEDARDSPPPSASRSFKRAKNKLAEDDAEIKALERALGLKGNKKLPKSFQEDGLDTLLEDLDNIEDRPHLKGEKRKSTEGDAWLENKRLKALHGSLVREEGLCKPNLVDISDDLTGNQPENHGDSGWENKEVMTGDESSDLDFLDSLNADTPLDLPPTRVRENPYVAPMQPSDTSPPAKYVPPSKRALGTSNTEDAQRLRQQIQGLLNRLSEAKILTVIGNVEQLYRSHPRQNVSVTLIDLLIGLLSDPTALQDTFIILHAGFIAAVYKVLGTDFGAQVIERIVEEFDHIYAMPVEHNNSGKKLINLVSLLSELYNFQVIGSVLLYDLIRTFISELSESNTELLLKTMRNSGHQLRQDDPSSLKDIVLMLQSAIAKIGPESLSVRTKFMIETINNLKNNRTKTGMAASTITSEHTIRMKKILGSLNTRSLKATEPLRVGLADIRDTEKRGKWWLVGASFKVDEPNGRESPWHVVTGKGHPAEKGVDKLNDDQASLLQLARDHRMNTDVRRSIFITVMSANDHHDAHLKLLKLRLKKSQELEIPKVLIHCASSQEVYNPYYTLLSRRLCVDRKLKMAFQFSLWDAFKKMGEGGNGDRDDDDREDVLEMRAIVNLAKMFGMLVIQGALGLGILKTLNLVYLHPKIHVFVELFLITVLVQSQKVNESGQDERPISDLFLKLEDMPELARGLQYFLKKVVSKTDVAGSKQDRTIVKWGCRVAHDALSAIATTAVSRD